MKYCIYQMEIVFGNPKENRKKVAGWIKQTVNEEKPDTIVLPEMWTTAYAFDDLENLADDNGEPTIAFLQDMASTYHINIVGGSFANQKDNEIYNSSVVIDRNGDVIHQYDKLHLVPMLDEHLYLTGGKNKATVFHLDGVKMGIIICYDLRFPELLRKLALEGAQVVHIVAEWPAARRDHWEILQQARAIENQMYIISSNVVGNYNHVDFAGTSMVIDPWGEVIIKGSRTKEEIIRATLKLDKVVDIRKEVPVFSSRVPDYY
ncbi:MULTISPECIES: carbon-nitrogen family hydrolase [Virgibacillus]|uniref:(R)-stereoselective amidase n=1 Tax=Virgibacillus massiliensis TaxID=1462526 RepID=A0A024QGL3_9BACI|nr:MULTISPECIES: carbon-nitrogen family hydrolase [Virgibacillus]EQB34657.1 hypothetical protein M948_19925 [Virgibacillus sp. CM-4]MYL43684.1 carbon-nitrogen family hydrolase [Virgibacillus massiliensis]CDQ41639.1 (R)-stereoselective amidase [Virgibacillus massiliensis]